MFAFVLNYAYLFRGDIPFRHIGSIEKGRGGRKHNTSFSPLQINVKIILPQVVKRTLPSIGNEVTFHLLKIHPLYMP